MAASQLRLRTIFCRFHGEKKEMNMTAVLRWEGRDVIVQGLKNNL